ncbi:MAG: glycosyltransferase [Bacteroidia bacterium]|jgi:glycosyltransferase involved in cell wall biosynthesis
MNLTKVIYLSYDGMTDPLGQSQVLPYLIGLSERGYEIFLVSCEKKERFNHRKQHIEHIIKDKAIHWHALPYHSKPPVISTLFDIRAMSKKVNEIIKHHQISLLHCRSYITALIGLEMKHKKGIPFIFDMRGFWADERVDGKIWNLKNPVFKLIYQFFKQKEKAFVVESAHIISLTHRAKEEIIAWQLPVKKALEIAVIPCCADFNHFSLDKINDLVLQNWRQKVGLTAQDFVISYIGSLGTWYMLPEMIDLIKTATEKIPHLKFLIITADDQQIAMQAAEEKKLNATQIIVIKAEREEVPYLIALSHFSMFFIKPAYSKMASSPTKLAEILGMGVPVLCNANVGDVESIVLDGSAGVVIKSFNRESYQEGIDKILKMLPAKKQQIATYAQKYASLEDGINTYKLIYDKISSNRHSIV